jgi:NTP pyrophosphatase (non-canonical NTP hydrolase)
MGYNSEGKQYVLLAEDLRHMSARIDDEPSNKANSDLENFLLRTSVKLAEETGELAEAIIGVTAQNPRKGQTHTYEDVDKELLDIATTALGAWEHRHGNEGGSLHALAAHVALVRGRQINSDMVAAQQARAAERRVS